MFLLGIRIETVLNYFNFLIILKSQEEDSQFQIKVHLQKEQFSGK